MFGRLTRWLTGDGDDAPPPPCSARLRMMELERRDNPALNVWLGTTDSFTTASYWSDGVPTPDDILVFRGPINTSTNPPLPQSGSNTSVTFVSIPPPVPYAPDTYAGVRIIDDYSGTLTIPFDIKFGEYTQTSGNTSTPGKNVTIDGSFSWKGGHLNTSSTAGEYRIAVPLGVMDPNGGSVSSGSTIRLQANWAGIAGAVEMLAGDYTMRIGQSIIVQDESILRIKAPVPRNLPPPPPPIPGKITINFEEAGLKNGELKVEPDSICEVEADERGTSTLPARVELKAKEPKLINWGIVKIMDTSELLFTPDTGEDGGLVQKGNDAVTQITAGCKITGMQSAGVTIEKGRLELREALGEDGEPLADQPDVVIQGSNTEVDQYALKLEAGTFLKRADVGPSKKIKLRIEGHLLCSGTIEMYASPIADRNDRIQASGRVWLDDAVSILEVKWFDETGDVRAIGSEWTLITSAYTGNLAGPVTLPKILSQPDKTKITLFDPPTLADMNKTLLVKRKA